MYLPRLPTPARAMVCRVSGMILKNGKRRRKRMAYANFKDEKWKREISGKMERKLENKR